MESEDLEIEKEIIDLLKDNGVELEPEIENQIILKIKEVYEYGYYDGREEGYEEGCDDIIWGLDM